MKYQYKRERSEFWVTIYENADASYNISTNNKYVRLINFFFPMFENDSPTKWKRSETYSSLWLPEGRYDQNVVKSFMNWCIGVTQDVLWLYLNKNISPYFDDELDYCIASDFNFDLVYGNGRTEIGKAEYELKYNISNLSRSERAKYADIIINKMMDNCKYIPINNRDDWYLSPMPASESGKGKLAWLLADEIAHRMGISFINAELKCDKPQMKQLSIADKVTVWREIYYNGNVQIDKNVRGKNVIVIDDLYQSGTTMWQYASFLKEMGARMVFGVVCVKSLKDSDNI
ncbi:MAG: phosphoribosyltransferase [Butyrivibrio sp.]|nr:phosphoribosyltransferase [Butyrivibrio sp.]